MLLRSSSTPVLGSLLCSISDSPINESSTSSRHFPSNSFHPNYSRFSFHPSPGSLNLSTAVSCGSSPISPSFAVDQFCDLDHKGIRRAQSEGNLEGLVHSACDSYSNDEFYNQNQPNKHFPARYKRLMLETIPSFSLCNSSGRCEEEAEEEDDEDGSEIEEEEEEEVLESSEERVMAASHELKTISRENMLLLNEQEVKVGDRMWNVDFGHGGGLVGQEIFLAKGLGSDGGSRGGFSGGSGGGGGRGGEFVDPAGSGEDGGDKHEVEQYYRRMVEENPGNALFLGNYAQFLYQAKRDLEGAEEYYERAILADPNDGEILSQYAKLVWELHHDQERASTHFERAVQASPQDSHVHAAYASFLWETEEDEDECAVPSYRDCKPPQYLQGALATA